MPSESVQTSLIMLSVQYNDVAVGIKLAHQGLHEPDSVVLSNSRAKGALESLY